jgi:hypothetical protein
MSFECSNDSHKSWNNIQNTLQPLLDLANLKITAKPGHTLLDSVNAIARHMVMPKAFPRKKPIKASPKNVRRYHTFRNRSLRRDRPSGRTLNPPLKKTKPNESTTITIGAHENDPPPQQVVHHGATPVP